MAETAANVLRSSFDSDTMILIDRGDVMPADVLNREYSVSNSSR